MFANDRKSFDFAAPNPARMAQTRLSLVLLPEQNERLKRLLEKTGESSISKLATDALHLYEYLLSVQMSGARICIHPANGAVPEDLVFENIDESNL